MPPKKQYSLDFLRAIAIILVFLWHYRRYGTPYGLQSISKFGWTGVDLFFVLSGYLIGFQLFEKIKNENSLSLKEFYTRRFFRIIPAYLTVLLLYLSLPGFSEREGMSPTWKFFTFTMNFGLNYQEAGSFSHAWSLCIEEQFYLLLPLLILLFISLKVRVRFIVIFLGLIFTGGFFIRALLWTKNILPLYETSADMSLIGNTYSTEIYYPSYNRLDGLLIGIVVALLFVFKPDIKGKLLSRSNFFLVTGLLLLVFSYFIANGQFDFSSAVFSYPLVSVAYGCVLVSALSSNFIFQKFKFSFFSFLALISYSFYLLHKQINHLVVNLLQPYQINQYVQMSLCFLLSILAALVLYVVVEKPCLNLRRKLLGRGQNPGTPRPGLG